MGGNLERVAKKFDKWIVKPMSLASKFPICTKVLAAYYLPNSLSRAYYLLEKILIYFMW